MFHSIITRSFINAIGVVIYTFAVGWLMFNAEGMFGKITGFFGIAMFLMLFVVSATIVGLLVLGQPIIMYFNEQKAQAIRLLMYTISWLVVATFILFIVLGLTASA